MTYQNWYTDSQISLYKYLPLASCFGLSALLDHIVTESYYETAESRSCINIAIVNSVQLDILWEYIHLELSTCTNGG